MLVWGAGARTRVRSWWGDIGMAHVPTAELVGGVGADAEGLGQAPPHSSVHGGRGTTRHPGGVGGLGDTEPGALKAVFVGGGLREVTCHTEPVTRAGEVGSGGALQPCGALHVKAQTCACKHRPP